MVQLLYGAVPLLETVLRLIPGAYSAWLRLWGSRIGKGGYRTPQVQVLDRSLLEVGDGAVFGHEVKVACRVIKPSRIGILLAGGEAGV